MQQMKRDKMVDVFNAVKHVRLRQPDAIPTLVSLFLFGFIGKTRMYSSRMHTVCRSAVSRGEGGAGVSAWGIADGNKTKLTILPTLTQRTPKNSGSKKVFILWDLI